MRPLTFVLGIVSALAVMSGCGPAATHDGEIGPNVRLGEGESLELIGWSDEQLGILREEWKEGVDWTGFFRVSIAPTVGQESMPMAGSYELSANRLRFVPRFALNPGATYVVSFDLGRFPRKPVARSGSQSFTAPGRSASSLPTTVSAVFPSRATVPENLLKLYIHFSAPMSRGEAYRRIHLVGPAGKEVEGAFLELDQELWNDDQSRFTLLFDPGRIKRELLPRELLGPALEAGNSYTLVIDEAWLDATGRPLARGFRKAFSVGPPVERQPDPATWKLVPPPAGTPQPLLVDFPEPMDRALLERVLRVVDANGGIVTGTVRVSNDETRWHLAPATPWSAGAYHLEAETILEDLAGNSLARPFEVDLFLPVEKRVASERARLPFVVR